MSKVGKTFTVDIDVLVWLESHARKKNMKESALVNGMLRSAMRQHQTWKCPECTAVNDNQFTTCHSCDYVLSFEDVKA
jgi:phage FluMu protein Com